MSDKFSTHRVLLLTYAFPPLQAAESFLCVKALAKIKSFDIDILTIDTSQLGLAIDNSLENYSVRNFNKIYRVHPPSWIDEIVFKLLRYIK